MSIQNKLAEAVRNKAPDLDFRKKRNILELIDASFVYAIRIERGKYPQIPEYRVVFLKYKMNDEWRDTSPLSLSEEYIMPFSLVKKLHLLEDNTSSLKDKVSYLNWLFSPDKDWFYITTDIQLNFVITECVDGILTQFLKFKSQQENKE